MCDDMLYFSHTVLNFFPSFSVDDECLSDDGRRTGMCMNVYECRIQGKAFDNSLSLHIVH